LAIASQPCESLQSTIFGANPILNTATAKTIQIYLPTGEPRGIRIADITTRLVLAVLIPRSELATGKQRWELDHLGVYFLFGEDEDGAKPIVYIGQTEDARKRFDSHNKTKTFWKTAIFGVSKSQNFEVDPIIRTTGGPALDSGRRSFSTPEAIDFPGCLIN
jgi:hypothetical protein